MRRILALEVLHIFMTVMCQEDKAMNEREQQCGKGCDRKTMYMNDHSRNHPLHDRFSNLVYIENVSSVCACAYKKES